MKNKFFAFLLFAFSPCALLAQKKIVFAGNVQAGLLEGETGGAFQLNASAGVKRGTWTTTLGAGLDYYHLRSIPVFLQVQKDFGKAKAPFVYAAGGYKFPWLRAQDKGWNIGDPKGGFYGDAGVGYRLPVSKSSALQFSVGYSVKNMTTTNSDWFIIAIYPPPASVLYEQHQTLRRISIKAGLWF